MTGNGGGLDPAAYKNGQPIAPVTTDERGEPTATPQPKVIAATIGAGVGVAIAEIGIYIVEAAAAIDIPSGIEAAIAVVVVAGLGFLSGYVKRPSPAAS